MTSSPAALDARERLDTPRSPYTPSVRFVALMGLIAALGAVSTDMYLPSLPAVAADLGASAAAAAFTISGVLLGGALGQLLIGPLSDRFGRRRPALIGIALHVVASLLCIVVPSIGPLIILRMIQGIGNSAATVTALAVIRDRLSGAAAARVLSRLMLVIGVAPLLAPTVGGLIAGVAGWRAVFAVLAAFGIVLWILVWRFLPETLPAERRVTRGVGSALRGYGVLLRDGRFMALAVLPGLTMATIMSYVAAAPFVLQLGFGLTAHQFALLFALNGVAGISASQVNAALVRRVEPIRILRVAVPVALLLGGALLTVAVTGAGGIVALLVPLWLLMGAIMFIPANATALALTRHGERAGTAAALVGAMQAGVAGAVSPLVGIMGGNAVAMGVTITGILVVGLVVLAIGTPAYRRGGGSAVHGPAAHRPGVDGPATAGPAVHGSATVGLEPQPNASRHAASPPAGLDTPSATAQTPAADRDADSNVGLTPTVPAVVDLSGGPTAPRQHELACCR